MKPDAAPWHSVERLAKRSAVILALLVGYWAAFMPAYRSLGSAAFLFGLVPCLTAAVLLGARGALVTVVLVVLVDRSSALELRGPDTGPSIAVIATLVKLLLAGGTGLVVDSRRRLRALNARLHAEVEARARSEAGRALSENLHRAVVESMGEGVGLFDADDRIVFANKALATTLKVSEDELLGRRLWEFLSDEPSKANDGGARRPGQPLSYDVTLRSDEATLLLVAETILDSSSHSEPLTVRVVRDLTDRVVGERRRHELELEVQHSQALGSLAVLAGGVAHDFNNLLGGVVGNAEIALRRLPANAPPALAHCLGEIQSFAGEAAQLSRQMLAYAGRRSLSIEATNANLEVKQALRLLHASIEAKARLVLELSEDLPEIAADPFQLRQVVTNLVLNALEAMSSERGTLTIRTERLRIDGQDPEQPELTPGQYVKLTVEDTGNGIKPEDRARIFEPFFSTKAAGRGMGLAAVVGIVRAHRGWLGLEAGSLQGTTFRVLLPAARPTTPRRDSIRREPPAPLAARSILLIDDEPAVRLVTQRLLSELGHRVLTADSGGRAVDLFRKQSESIDLVLLDLTMPELSGAEVLAELRRLRHDVRVVITSGFHPADAADILSAPNVVGFLEKPHTLGSLEGLLASVEAPSSSLGARETRTASHSQRWN